MCFLFSHLLSKSNAFGQGPCESQHVRRIRAQQSHYTIVRSKPSGFKSKSKSKQHAFDCLIHVGRRNVHTKPSFDTNTFFNKRSLSHAHARKGPHVNSNLAMSKAFSKDRTYTHTQTRTHAPTPVVEDEKTHARVQHPQSQSKIARWRRDRSPRVARS